MSKVIIRECGDYDAPAVENIVDEVFDTFDTPVAGKKVLVKPNILGGFKPERGVTTHPVFISALVKTLRSRGAAQVMVGDNPGMGGYAKSERAARVAGIVEAAGDAFKNISQAGERVEVQGQTLMVSKDVFDADVIVNLPRLKTHALTGYTGAIKNMFGIVVGNDKVNAHRYFPAPDDFSKVMADICALRPPELTILDGIVSMEGNGPNAGRLRKTGKILASSDPVALDYAALEMIGIPHTHVPMVDRARELGLGDYEHIELDGNLEKIKNFKLPITMSLPKGFIKNVVNRVACYFIARRIPKLIKKKCTACKICVEQCPAEALTMVDKRPKLDKKKCISCFCCNELCPETAWKLKIKFT